MFLRLFPSRLKYQQIHIHRERFTVHQFCIIPAEELMGPRHRMNLQSAMYGTHTRAEDSLPRLPDLRGVTVQSGVASERETRAREWAIFSNHF